MDGNTAHAINAIVAADFRSNGTDSELSEIETDPILTGAFSTR